MNFAGKRVLITGASSGIGAELAKQLAGHNSKLVLSARNLERLKAVSKSLTVASGNVIEVAGDISDESFCRDLIEKTVSKFGGLDVLVLNAGISMNALFEDVENLSIFSSLMQTNVLGPIYCTKYALPHLRASRGVIVVVSSLLGKTGCPTRTGYSASKHALHGFFDSLRSELHGSGMQITLVCPGPVLTEIRERALAGAQAGKKSSMDESESMSVVECARRLIAAVEKEKREELMTFSGKVGSFLKLVAPSFVDSVVRKKLGMA